MIEKEEKRKRDVEKMKVDYEDMMVEYQIQYASKVGFNNFKQMSAENR